MRMKLCMTAVLSLSLIGCGGPEGGKGKANSKQADDGPPVKVDRSFLKVFGDALPKLVDNKENPVTDAKIDLGRMLYYETRLSKSNKISCNSCHGLDKYGVDGDPTSTGHDGQKGGRNAPTVYHAAGHITQFWDGRAKDVEEQAKGPILNPIEMAMASADAVMAKLKGIAGYPEAFKKAFPDDAEPLTYDNLGKAIGAFERKLMTPAPFDKYLAGDESALTNAQKKGLNLFMNLGCTNCHNGPYIGGNMYQKLGLLKPWPKTDDLGRFAVTKDEKDKMFFKVPSLRNIDKTGPYFHDGAVATLEEAVKLMGTHQLNKELSDEQVGSIIAFLKSLTGPLDEAYIAQPKLP